MPGTVLGIKESVSGEKDRQGMGWSYNDETKTQKVRVLVLHWFLLHQRTFGKV